MSDKDTKSGRSTTRIRGRDVSYRTIAVLVLLVLAVWFVLANTASTEIRLWVPTVTMPLWLVLVVSLLVGGLIGWLLSRRRDRGR